MAIGGLADQLGPGGLRQIGESVSFNGKALAFWGAWGEETVQQQLLCGTDGNQVLLEYCREQSPAGDGVYIKELPVNQGIFLTEVDSLVARLVASTGAQFDTFLNWNFSGRPPGVGESVGPESELELARWRPSAFVALEDRWLASKAEQLAPVDGSVVAQIQDGIYLADLLSRDNGVQSLLQTGQDGGMRDPQAQGMAITALGLERDGFRRGRLAFVANMANEEESWAGISTADPPSTGADSSPRTAAAAAPGPGWLEQTAHPALGN